MTADIYLGLMSGTSADAIDAVAVDFSDATVTILASCTIPLPPETRQAIHQLATPGINEIDQLGQLDSQLGELFARSVNQLINDFGLDRKAIKAIGSHGQTIRHRPPGSAPCAFTLQVGDPNIIAQRTFITTVADFRRRDMAAGGQGAPLVPAFHKAVFEHPSTNRVILNIGGIANITWLPNNGAVLGFDTGPGNVLMDAWTLRHLNKAYDANGAWAASGAINDSLLKHLLEHPFLLQSPPKSTGREDFNPQWLDSCLEQWPSSLNSQDVQATLLAYTAQTIADQIKKLVKNDNAEVYVCGGGVYNGQLMIKLQTLLLDCPLYTTAKLGIAPEWIEATAFAWLAKQTMERQSGNLCAVTGAKEPVILGGIYPA